ncbi:protein CHUP1, chloroplastic-like protein [Cinnamomum micranthum f. kanehirae]|uniref:Protein CHUP1, chloroplastic-like protein n=1 Tax=Cinnamomum micranthum f. kanehirae TaxID=337451 RepID=A0A443Q4E2_9MAGN|nr:protein CHUP1, chloroplastic-like protein [Cinnamomum micranthum f. kanehirae]
MEWRQVYLFECNWFNVGDRKRGVRVDDHMISVNMNMTWYKDEPFVLASQASQCFYIRDLKAKGNWGVVQNYTNRNVYNIPPVPRVLEYIDGESSDDDADQEDESSYYYALVQCDACPVSTPLGRTEILPSHIDARAVIDQDGQGIHSMDFINDDIIASGSGEAYGDGEYSDEGDLSTGEESVNDWEQVHEAEGASEVLVPVASYRTHIEPVDHVEHVSLHTTVPRRLMIKEARMTPHNPQVSPGSLHASTQFPHRLLFGNPHQLENNHLPENLQAVMKILVYTTNWRYIAMVEMCQVAGNRDQLNTLLLQLAEQVLNILLIHFQESTAITKSSVTMEMVVLGSKTDSREDKSFLCGKLLPILERLELLGEMARNQDRNQKKAFHSSVYTDKKQAFKPVDQGDSSLPIINTKEKVVKVASSMVSSLKEVCNTFVATVSRLDVSGAEIQNWLFSEKNIQVDVKSISSYLFRIKPLLQQDFFQLNQMESVLIGSPIRRLDRWMEVLGPVVQPTWIQPIVSVLLKDVRSNVEGVATSVYGPATINEKVAFLARAFSSGWHVELSLVDWRGFQEL